MAATRIAIKYYLKTKGQGNMDCFHVRPQQSTILLQKTWLTSSLATGNGSYWSRRKTMHEWKQRDFGEAPARNSSCHPLLHLAPQAGMARNRLSGCSVLCMQCPLGKEKQLLPWNTHNLDQAGFVYFLGQLINIEKKSHLLLSNMQLESLIFFFLSWFSDSP